MPTITRTMSAPTSGWSGVFDMAKEYLWLECARIVQVACVTAIAASCADWSPSLGSAQTECSYSSPEGNPGTEYGSYGTGSGTCVLFNAGDDCDDCQAANCCALSRNCYYDPSCQSADEELDHCTTDASSALTPAGVQAGIAQCRAVFAASGAYAQGVIACEATC